MSNDLPRVVMLEDVGGGLASWQELHSRESSDISLALISVFSRIKLPKIKNQLRLNKMKMTVTVITLTKTFYGRTLRLHDMNSVDYFHANL